VVLSDAGDTVKVGAFGATASPRGHSRFRCPVAPYRRHQPRLPRRHHHRIVRTSQRQRCADVRLRLPRPRGPARPTSACGPDDPNVDGLRPAGTPRRPRFRLEQPEPDARQQLALPGPVHGLDPGPGLRRRAENVIYLTTLQDGQMTIVGLDWATGVQVATIELPTPSGSTPPASSSTRSPMAASRSADASDPSASPNPDSTPSTSRQLDTRCRHPVIPRSTYECVQHPLAVVIRARQVGMRAPPPRDEPFRRGGEGAANRC
jgi:hypothetical protein